MALGLQPFGSLNINERGEKYTVHLFCTINEHERNTETEWTKKYKYMVH